MCGAAKLHVHGHYQWSPSPGWQHVLPVLQPQKVQLRICQLPQIPVALSRLTALQTLVIGLGPLWSGSQHLAGLTQLEELEIGGCHGTRLLPSLSLLTKLRKLDIGLNQGNWQHLAPLLQLEELALSPGAQLPAVMAQLTAMTKLKICNIGTSKLQGGWQHLELMARLRHLIMEHCKLDQLPPLLARLTALRHISISGNPGLPGGLHHLRHLHQLQELHLERCDVTEVPQQLSHLTGLTRLDICSNPLWEQRFVGGWQHLGSLCQLRHLDLTSMHLTELPEQVSRMTCLTQLHISRNPIAGGWHRLLPLPHLVKLNAWKCLDAVPPELATLQQRQGLQICTSTSCQT